MSHRAIALCLALALLAGCGGGPYHTPSHAVKLASGATVVVTSFNLAWGGEHDEHTIGHDCFAIEYVSAVPGASAERREAEATQVFELVRPISEQWGLDEAQMAAFPTLERKGHYDLYAFQRQPDGHWTFKRSDAKVFVTD